MEFILGRKGTQPFKIDAACEGVSEKHAKLTIEGEVWTIEDLDSTNGTYIRDQSGEFRLISKKKISENSIIRLGRGGYRSYTLMAHRVMAKEGDYSYEFDVLRKMYSSQAEQEAKQEKVNTRNGWIAKCSGVVAILLCSFVGLFVTIGSGIRYFAIAFAPIIVGLLFRNDNAKLKKMRERRRNFLVCPKCKRPLSDFDIDNLQCSACKAK
ncbi:MAG: FHA domain-containing protein [Prevotellaceae bacterium]|jgi:hypothetical protein|nr:FHA domain-containing protein [Prevotellaceae bacterium]